MSVFVETLNASFGTNYPETTPRETRDYGFVDPGASVMVVTDMGGRVKGRSPFNSRGGTDSARRRGCEPWRGTRGTRGTWRLGAAQLRQPADFQRQQGVGNIPHLSTFVAATRVIDSV